MDPITRACAEYDQYLRGGGMPVEWSGTHNNSTRGKDKRLHPSSVGPGLCHRKQAYNIMADVGELKPDVPDVPEEMLGHRIGFICQEYVAAALANKGALAHYELPAETDDWTGRIDMIVDPSKLDCDSGNPPAYNNGSMWLVDVKTVKGYGLYGRYPKEYHVGQVTQYKTLLEETGFDIPLVPMLYYMTRVDFTSLLSWWSWHGADCVAQDWNKPQPVKSFKGLAEDFKKGRDSQLNWLHGGELPPRCGNTPAEHPFMCARKGRAKAAPHTPTCKFFMTCWGIDNRDEFSAESWGMDDMPF